ncbi:putative anti-sigma factor antagonist BtrV [Azospirillaceae bacterium]
MVIIEQNTGDVVVIVPQGRIDSNTAKEFEEVILAAITPQSPAMVVDCNQLDYVSSAGLRVLLMAAKRIKAAKGRLALCGLKPHVQEVFDVSGFSTIFAIQAGRDAALATVRGA